MYLDPNYVEILGNQNFEITYFWAFFRTITEYTFVILGTTTF